MVSSVSVAMDQVVVSLSWRKCYLYYKNRTSDDYRLLLSTFTTLRRRLGDNLSAIRSTSLGFGLW